MILLLCISGFAALFLLAHLNERLGLIKCTEANEGTMVILAHIIVLGLPFVLGFILLKLGWKL
jgi:hypothetical protein